VECPNKFDPTACSGTAVFFFSRFTFFDASGKLGYTKVCNLVSFYYR
jgi:hypothetical protein